MIWLSPARELEILRSLRTSRFFGLLLAGVTVPIVLAALPAYTKIRELEVRDRKNHWDTQIKMKELDTQIEIKELEFRRENFKPVSRSVSSEVEKTRLLDKYSWFEELGDNTEAELENKARK
jgi:hypothetical protein